MQQQDRRSFRRAGIDEGHAEVAGVDLPERGPGVSLAGAHGCEARCGDHHGGGAKQVPPLAIDPFRHAAR